MVIRLLILAFVTAFFYRKTLNYGYIIDDIEVSTHKQTGRFWKDLWYQIRGHAYFNARREHAITVFFHVLNTMLVYLAFGANNTSFIAALFFGLNPVATQASVWLSGKVYSIATTLILLGWWIKPLFPILYFSAFYFSLNVVLFPLLFLFTPYLYFVGLPVLLAFAYKDRVVKEPRRRYKQGSTLMRELSPRKVIISVKTIGYYFRLCLFPFKLGMCHKYLHEYGLSEQETEKWYTFDKYFWLGVVVLLFTPVSVFYFKTYALVWFVLLMLQWCNFLILNHPVCERYAYLANAGLMFGLAQVLMAIPYGTYLAVGIGVFYATKLWFYLPAYETNYAYFHHNREDFKDVAIGYNQEGLEAIRFGQPNKGLDIFMQGLFVRPWDFRLNYNSANLLLGMGKLGEARFFVHRAEQNLDKQLDNYDQWMNGINQMKNHLRKHNINVN